MSNIDTKKECVRVGVRPQSIKPWRPPISLICDCDNWSRFLHTSDSVIVYEHFKWVTATIHPKRVHEEGKVEIDVQFKLHSQHQNECRIQEVQFALLFVPLLVAKALWDAPLSFQQTISLSSSRKRRCFTMILKFVPNFPAAFPSNCS